MHWFWWVLFALFLVWIISATLRGPRRFHREQSPLDILKKRLARGEISKEEYEEKKKILEEGPALSK